MEHYFIQNIHDQYSTAKIAHKLYSKPTPCSTVAWLLTNQNNFCSIINLILIIN